VEADFWQLFERELSALVERKKRLIQKRGEPRL